MAEQWVKNTLYCELIASPIWLHAAFTRDGVFKVDPNGIRLIRYLVMNTRVKCPSWGDDMIDSYINMDAYTDLVRDAWESVKETWGPSGGVGYF